MEWVEKEIYHILTVVVPRITCEDGAYHPSKPLISEFGVVVSLCV